MALWRSGPGNVQAQPPKHSGMSVIKSSTKNTRGVRSDNVKEIRMILLISVINEVVGM
ncbi:Uncharacterised protein [Bordetella ansorpii]|uniref:Uncharacterized protein n=1 Tax=Bordetella ansorpii TaxID=288768 RepID=A0A157QMB6_9BORD|nr:Uncharacterised protein [Bordetella ansorpii]